MAPIYRGDTEVLEGQLKLGNTDVKEVYLGSEKIWPAGPPPGVDNILWEPSKDPAPLNMVPTLTVTRNASVPSGTPPNIASTTVEHNWSKYEQTGKIVVNAINPSAYQYIINPQMRLRFMVRDWVVGPTDLNCYIRMTIGVTSSRADYVRGAPSHILEGELSFGGKKQTILSQTGEYFGTSGLTFTTTQTINEYIENRQYLDFTHTWCQGNSSNYNRFVNGSNISYMSIKKIEAIAAGRRRPIRDALKERLTMTREGDES